MPLYTQTCRGCGRRFPVFRHAVTDGKLSMHPTSVPDGNQMLLGDHQSYLTLSPDEAQAARAQGRPLFKAHFAMSPGCRKAAAPSHDEHRAAAKVECLGGGLLKKRKPHQISTAKSVLIERDGVKSQCCTKHLVGLMVMGWRTR